MGNRRPSKQYITIKEPKWESSRGIKAIRGKPIPLLANGEWDCMEVDIAWKVYKRAPTQVVRMWMFQKKLTQDANSSSRGGMQMLGKQDRKSTREIIEELD